VLSPHPDSIPTPPTHPRRRRRMQRLARALGSSSSNVGSGLFFLGLQRQRLCLLSRGVHHWGLEHRHASSSSPVSAEIASLKQRLVQVGMSEHAFKEPTRPRPLVCVPWPPSTLCPSRSSPPIGFPLQQTRARAHPPTYTHQITNVVFEGFYDREASLTALCDAFSTRLQIKKANPSTTVPLTVLSLHCPLRLFSLTSPTTLRL